MLRERWELPHRNSEKLEPQGGSLELMSRLGCGQPLLVNAVQTREEKGIAL